MDAPGVLLADFKREAGDGFPGVGGHGCGSIKVVSKAQVKRTQHDEPVMPHDGSGGKPPSLWIGLNEEFKLYSGVFHVDGSCGLGRRPSQ